MIKITNKLCHTYIATLIDIGIVTTDNLRIYSDIAHDTAKYIASNVVSDNVDNYVIDDSTIDYIATQVADCLMLVAKKFFYESEKRFGICLF